MWGQFLFQDCYASQGAEGVGGVFIPLELSDMVWGERLDALFIVGIRQLALQLEIGWLWMKNPI